MHQIIEYLTSKSIVELAAEPRVLFGAVAVFVLSVLFRWKYVTLLLCTIAAMLTVLRFTTGTGGSEVIADKDMLVLAGGTLVVSIVLIYFLFIRD